MVWQRSAFPATPPLQPVVVDGHLPRKGTSKWSRGHDEKGRLVAHYTAAHIHHVGNIPPDLSPLAQPAAYSPSTYAHEGTPTGGDCWRRMSWQVEGSNPGTLPVPIQGSPQRRRGTRRVGVIHRVLRVGQKSCREVARCCFFYNCGKSAAASGHLAPSLREREKRKPSDRAGRIGA